MKNKNIVSDFFNDLAATLITRTVISKKQKDILIQQKSRKNYGIHLEKIHDINIMISRLKEKINSSNEEKVVHFLNEINKDLALIKSGHHDLEINNLIYNICANLQLANISLEVL
ncbi:MAG: hypothetical protein ACRC42_00110 [Mycoplasma sp.]